MRACTGHHHHQPDCCRVAWQYTRAEGKGMGLLCDLDEAIAHGYRSCRTVSDRIV